MSEEILINITPMESRVAVVENGVLQEVHVERTQRRGIVGNIYKGKVVRVLPGMQARDALAIAQRIREQTEGVRLRSLPELRITSSIGVAPADHRHSSLRAWIDAADAALYVAKNGGRNQVAGCMEPALVPAV